MILKIISFSGKTIENSQVSSISISTKSGEITILENHMPLIGIVKPSVLTFSFLDENNMTKQEKIAVGSGVIDVNQNLIKISLDSVFCQEDINIEKIEEAKQNAIKLMEKYKDSKDKIDMEKFIEAEDIMLKSIAQLKISEIK